MITIIKIPLEEIITSTELSKIEDAETDINIYESIGDFWNINYYLNGEDGYWLIIEILDNREELKEKIEKTILHFKERL